MTITLNFNKFGKFVGAAALAFLLGCGIGAGIVAAGIPIMVAIGFL